MTDAPAARAPRLLVISDRSLRSLPALVELAARLRDAAPPGEVGLYFREPGLSDREALAALDRLVRAASAAGGAVPVYVRGRFDWALAAGAAGVQLQASGPHPREIRAAAPALRLGYSAHRIDEVAQVAPHVDHLTFSPVFATPGKGPPAGPAALAEACRAAGRTPVLALGGIDGPQRVREVLRRGAWGVAVIRAVIADGDPVAAARILLGAFGRPI